MTTWICYFDCPRWRFHMDVPHHPLCRVEFDEEEDSES